MKRFILFPILLFTLKMGYSQAGSPDNSFGQNGIVTTVVGTPTISYAEDVAVQPDGKIVVCGYTSLAPGISGMAIVRYNPNGTPDNSFGVGGKVTNSIGGVNSSARGLAIQPDGKIIVSGFAKIGDNYIIALARYKPNGTPDNSFDTDGILTTFIGSGNSVANDIALQSDGKIVIAGYSITGGNKAVMTVVRYKTDGTLDNTFSGDGIATQAVGQAESLAYALAIQPDGKIVVTGETSDDFNDYDFVTLRFKTDGTPDNSFSGDGIAVKDVGPKGDAGYAVLVQPNGRIVVAGWTETAEEKTNIALLRYKTDGTLDASFDGDGIVSTTLGQGIDACQAAVLQPDGKIVVGGKSSNGTNLDFALVRYLPDGTLDDTFDEDGKVTTAIGTSEEWIESLCLQPDGKIVAAGYTQTGGNASIAVVRYLGGSSTGVHDSNNNIQHPAVFPNPLSQGSVVEYQLMNTENVTIRLYDASGRCIRELASEQRQSAGEYHIPVDATDLARGVYWLCIEGEKTKATIKVIK